MFDFLFESNVLLIREQRCAQQEVTAIKASIESHIY